MAANGDGGRVEACAILGGHQANGTTRTSVAGKQIFDVTIRNFVGVARILSKIGDMDCRQERPCPRLKRHKRHGRRGASSAQLFISEHRYPRNPRRHDSRCERLLKCQRRTSLLMLQARECRYEETLEPGMRKPGKILQIRECRGREKEGRPPPPSKFCHQQPRCQ